MAYTTTSVLGGAGGHVIPKFYADFMRDRLWSSLYFRQLGTDVTIPRGYDNIKIPRWQSPYTVEADKNTGYVPQADSNLAAITTITEDGTITPKTLSAESIEGSTTIFAGAIGYTEKATLNSHASITDGAMENLVRELAWRIDNYTRAQISATAAAFERSALNDDWEASTTINTGNASNALLDGAAIAKVGPTMDSLNVPRWEDETFVCVVHPMSMADLMTDTEGTGFLEVAKYNDADFIYRGEMGRMYGVRFIQSNNVPLDSSGGGALSASVRGSHAYVVAPDAFYVITQEGGGVSVIHHPPGSAGINDPVNLKGTIGVKVYYGVVAAPSADHRLMWLTHSVSMLL